MTTLDFPDVLFGTSSSAYQIEGAWNEAGKSLSIFDTAYHEEQTSSANAGRRSLQSRGAPVFKTTPVDYYKRVLIFSFVNEIIQSNAPSGVNQANGCPVTHQGSGDIACDSYHKIDEDVKNLKDLGVDLYRFSISWPRIFPRGQNTSNPQGIDYYKKLIERLKAENIKPMVTLHHWDLPQELQDQGGWANKDVIEQFLVYCRFVFDTFGDDVKLWITVNEPRLICQGYGGCGFPPFLGDRHSGIEDYKAMRNLLLAHAKVYRMYESEFKTKQQGEVSICFDTSWMFPNDEKKEDDIEAAELALQSTVGVFVEPLISGEFPKVVLESIKKTNQLRKINFERLVPFEEEEKKILIGSYDFITFNYYFSLRVSPLSEDEKNNDNIPLKTIDQGVAQNWNPPPTDVRDGFTLVINWMNDKFNVSSKSGSHKFFIGENGSSEECKKKVQYHQDMFEELHKAINNKINIFGYCVWSFMDSFEWGQGYNDKFGIYSVNFSDPLRPRSKKPCFDYFKNLFETKKLQIN